MPRTGNIYAPPSGTKGVSNTPILSTAYNAFVDDLTSDANAARPVTAGGTGATSASAARTALGLDIGTNVQAYDAGLQSIAGLVTAADTMIYTTALDVYATTSLTPFARTILDDAAATNVLTTLGFSAFSKTLIDDTSAGAWLTTLGVSSFIQTALDDTTALAASNTFQAVNFGAAQSLTDAQKGQARANISADLKGYLYGLTLSNNATDATNDIDIATGEATSDDSSVSRMVLASALTKRLDAAWAVGTGNGGLDTGSVGNNKYFVWLIQRSDTGVLDALFSLSATAPTMPANYDRKCLLGFFYRTSAVNGPVFSAFAGRTAFVSDLQTITAAGLVTMAHGLGRAPQRIDWEIVCVSASAGYAVGDVVYSPPVNSTTVSARFTSFYADATNVYVRYSADTIAFIVANKGTGVEASASNVNWRLRVRAYA